MKAKIFLLLILLVAVVFAVKESILPMIMGKPAGKGGKQPATSASPASPGTAQATAQDAAKAEASRVADLAKRTEAETFLAGLKLTSTFPGEPAIAIFGGKEYQPGVEVKTPSGETLTLQQVGDGFVVFRSRFAMHRVEIFIDPGKKAPPR